eukprot:1633274-Amphidinium_carterae.1
MEVAWATSCTFRVLSGHILQASVQCMFTQFLVLYQCEAGLKALASICLVGVAVVQVLATQTSTSRLQNRSPKPNTATLKGMKGPCWTN